MSPLLTYETANANQTKVFITPIFMEAISKNTWGQSWKRCCWISVITRISNNSNRKKYWTKRGKESIDITSGNRQDMDWQGLENCSAVVHTDSWSGFNLCPRKFLALTREKGRTEPFFSWYSISNGCEEKVSGYDICCATFSGPNYKS